MTKKFLLLALVTLTASTLLPTLALAQIGRRFPSEKKVVPDPVTGVPLTFLTSTPAGDSKIYPTHPQWTADGQWLIFRSNRVAGQAMAVNEHTGDIVQLTEAGYTGMLCIAPKSMKLFLMRFVDRVPPSAPEAPDAAKLHGSSTKSGAAIAKDRARGCMRIIEVNLERLFADSARGTLAEPTSYERICGTIEAEVGATGDMAVDASEGAAYF